MTDLTKLRSQLLSHLFMVIIHIVKCFPSLLEKRAWGSLLHWRTQ